MSEARLAWAMCPDARIEAGGGHVARCAALARALSAHGPVVAVLGAADGRWAPKFGGDIEIMAERDAATRFFAGVVLDDYRIDAAAVGSWRSHVLGPVVQLLDFGAPVSGVDLVINAAPGLCGECIAGVPALLGPSYAMLGAAYERRTRPPIRRDIEQITVGMGLIDSKGATGCILRALGSSFAADCWVDVLLSAQSPYREEVDALARQRKRWTLHVDAEAPWSILENADLCISAGGQSLLERLALGLPTIAIAVAENQRAAVAGAAAAGAALDLGALADWSDVKFVAAITDLARDVGRRAAMSAAAQALVDGHGAERVAAFLDRFAARCAPQSDRAGALRP